MKNEICLLGCIVGRNVNTITITYGYLVNGGFCHPSVCPWSNGRGPLQGSLYSEAGARAYSVPSIGIGAGNTQEGNKILASLKQISNKTAIVRTGEGTTDRSICFFCKGLKFSSQQPHWVAHNHL